MDFDYNCKGYRRNLPVIAIITLLPSEVLVLKVMSSNRLTPPIENKKDKISQNFEQ